MMTSVGWSYREDATQRRGRRIDAVQNVSRMCVVCGVANAAGLHARFYELEADGGRETAGAEGGAAAGRELLGIFTPRQEHQGYPGRMHGGILSAILDETIGRAITILHPGSWGVTAELTVRYRQPVPLDGEIRAIARITRDTRRLFEGSGELLLADGSVAVEASGKYLKMQIEEIAPSGFVASEWFADPREAPGEVDFDH